jgi:predicted ATPase
MVYVITGGPGFGKTTLIGLLAEKGFRVCPEEARSILDGIASLPGDFEQRIAGLRLKFLHSTDQETIAFADRGLPDQVAYSWYKKKQPSAFIEETVSSNRYAPFVFITPPWQDIYTSDAVRKENFEEACVIHKNIIRAYIKYGYQTIELPFSTPDMRVAYILTFLGI